MQAVAAALDKKKSLSAGWKKYKDSRGVKAFALAAVIMLLLALVMASMDWSTTGETEDGWTHFEGDCASRPLADTSVSWTLHDAKKGCFDNPDCVAVVEDQVKGKYHQRGTYCAQEKKPKWWQQTEMCTEDDKPIPGKGCGQQNTFWLTR